MATRHINMDHHDDHLGHRSGPRQTSESGSRQVMMPPFQSLPSNNQYSTSDIPRRSITDGTSMPLQTSPINMHGGSSPESHTGSTGYTWGANDSWPGRSPHHLGNRTPTTTPADTLPSFHSSPITSMSHLSIDQTTSVGSNHGILPPFRPNSTNYSSRPTPALGRSSSFPSPAGTMPPYVPGISSMLPMSTMGSSTRQGLSAPVPPLGSSGSVGQAPAPAGPGRLSPYATVHSGGYHQQSHYMHNLGSSGNPMALVSHYEPVQAAAAAAYGGPFNGMMFQPQQRQPDKPHQCDQCPTAFTRNHDLKRHKRIHWAVKPFPCDGCDKAFSRKDALKRHKLVKCCGKNGKDKREGSPVSSITQANSGEMSPEDPRR